MQFSTTFAILATFVVAASAASTSNLERRITDPGDPANLINCPPHGGADVCTFEKPCSRIRLNYGSQQQGHYIWYQYNVDNIPAGIQLEFQDACSS
ncbi:hypothetical protein GYMLUDRAFT_253223 [Collybiopsis luxurians FD-317 M1]|uniref:Uncharacterized protein n=1 Tax=Collybiopsis luxurians FD-317 M1 TaxID=944289 RepID=A0A0D0B7R7_9AGAR|nr:hypothetical protein GYMLUDRAFT_253223 [Collybiopsis luxurians FD-317 M1]